MLHLWFPLAADMENEDEQISLRVRRMMEANGVKKRGQASLLAEILRMSYSAATRKMRGKLPWKLEQLREVADHFGAPLEALVDASAAPRGAPQGGTFVVERRRFPCTIWFGDKPESASTEAVYVAYQHLDRYLVYPASDAPALPGLHVERLELEGASITGEAPLIAVVDDAADMAEMLCAYLAGHKLQARAYSSLREFELAMEDTGFDCIIIDWLFDGQTSAQTIARIRSSRTPCVPIFLLTGQLATGRADEDAIGEAIRRFGLQCMEKPVRPFILFAEIARALGLS